MANVVVSGKVVKLKADREHSTRDNQMYIGEIEIKRVFKGGAVVDSVATVNHGILRDYQIVTVEGFGDPGICDNKVSERDTKIFLLNPAGNGDLKLNSSIMPLTLRNLDYVDAVVNGKNKILREITT
ncbi:unnamed protein product [Lymnaea stagnalis]|uniref:NtA domain-containing protein n=1 Tax=Lymnaea stagnalis TaxID=6523 RepID=A0AAV2IJF7_LYMST